MSAFAKTNSYMVAKMAINQVGLTVFGLVLTAATSENALLMMLTSIFSVCFYWFLLYTMSWEAGIADKVRVDAGRAKAEPYKFFFLALIANSINLLLGILACVGASFCDPIAGAGPVWALNLYGITNAVARFIEAMYLGLIQYFAPYNPIALVLIAFPAVFVCGIGYIIGLNGRSIRQIFGVKPPSFSSGGKK